MVGDRRSPDVHYVFGNDVTAPRQARVALQSLLDDPEDPIVWGVTLAASELVTNVITHTAQGEGEMHVWDSKPGVPLRLEVHDQDTTLPARRTTRTRTPDLVNQRHHALFQRLV